jgi:uncharacterized protein with GYD domain
MPTFITLFNLTEQGVRKFKDTAKRAAAFAKAGKAAGVVVKEVYWTLGAFDGVLILEAPDDETAAAVLLMLGSKGNVRSQTLRAFTRREVGAILAKAK